MSRSNYSEDLSQSELALWGGAVRSAARGKRGQALLQELIDALDAMPVKELAVDALVTAEGEYCALGVLGAKRGLDLSKLDPEDAAAVAEAFNVAPALVQEIVYRNDEWDLPETPAQRWTRMRKSIHALLDPNINFAGEYNP